jgi:hypothetical protein
MNCSLTIASFPVDESTESFTDPCCKYSTSAHEAP